MDGPIAKFSPHLHKIFAIVFRPKVTYFVKVFISWILNTSMFIICIAPDCTMNTFITSPFYIEVKSHKTCLKTRNAKFSFSVYYKYYNYYFYYYYFKIYHTVQQIKRDTFKDMKEISLKTVNPYKPSACL